MNDIHSLVDFTVSHLKINERFVWFYDCAYKSELKPYMTIDSIDVYYTDNFDDFISNPMLASFIVFSTSDIHYIITIHKGIDFIKFFDYMIGYLGYDDLFRH